MNEVAYLAAAALAAVFVWAAAVKLARPDATAVLLRALTVPAPAVVARSLPVFELAIAAALLAVPAIGAAVALVTLAAFSIVLVQRIRAGTTAPCACFGTASHDPVSFVEVGRNGLLGILATVALFAPGPRWPTLEAAITVTTALVTGAVVLSLCRLRRDLGVVWSNHEAREGVRP